MKLSEYLKENRQTKTGLATWLGINKSLVGRWDEIPEKYAVMLESKLPEGVVARDWCIRKDHLNWKVMAPNGEIRVKRYGHGSEWDYEFSMAKIDFIRSLIKQLGSVGGVIEWIRPVEFPASFIADVSKDCVCPSVVDMHKNKVDGGKPIPVRVFPFGPRVDE